MENMTSFYIAAGMLLIAALSGLGVGSGGLLVIFLTSYFGIAPTEARVTNLLFFILSSAGALIVHTANGRIKYKLVTFIALFGIAGTFIGTALGRLIGDGVLKLIFGVMLIISGIATVFGKRIKAAIKGISHPQNRQSQPKIAHK